ncbi:MAG: hypothetical protein QNJ40_15220 [Xanthomonadales bacterium]|nr:hypothetical protein [Xanthomonadales bacterium]
MKTSQVAARTGLYLLLFAVVGALPVVDVSIGLFHNSQYFSEYSLVELTQSAVLTFSILAAVVITRRHLLPYLGFLLAALLLCALIREFDFLLDRGFEGLWELGVTTVLLCTALYLVPNRKTLQSELAFLATHFSFGIMLAGFAVTAGFSRMFGRGSFWQDLMGATYDRSVKNYAEEGVELAGYVLLMAGVIEFSIAAVRHFGLSPERVTGSRRPSPASRS